MKCLLKAVSLLIDEEGEENHRSTVFNGQMHLNGFKVFSSLNGDMNLFSVVSFNDLFNFY